MKRALALAILFAGLLHAVLPAEMEPPDALKFFKNYFVTGSHAVGGVGLQGRGLNGIATGAIEMRGVPEGADILAAFLYWQVVVKDGTGDAGAAGVTFGPWTELAPGGPSPGIPLSSADGPLAKTLGNGTPPCWSGGGGTGSSGGAHKTYTYRTDVLRFLRIDASKGEVSSGKYTVNGYYQVQLPDGNGATALGASLVVIYRDPAQPLKAIVLYDGAYTMDQSTEGMFQSIKWFYDGTGPVRLTHIVGSGQLNKSEILRFNGTSVATNPFRSSAGPGWDNPTFTHTQDVPPRPLVGLPTEVTTSVDHEGFSSFDCLTWAAIVYETPVKDSDEDGLLDAWETATAKNPIKDPYGQDLPYLGDMGANPELRDIFVEIGYMKTDAETCYGPACKPAHTHLPTPAAIKSVGEAFSKAGISLHVDAGIGYDLEGEAAPYVIRGEGLALGGEALNESITPPCDRLEGDPVWKCQFSEYPGTVGWKTGFRYIRDEVLSGPPPPEDPSEMDPCDVPGNNCTRRFDANRAGMFHYALFAHAIGLPKSLNACRKLNTALQWEESADVDGFCPAPYEENPAYRVPRTNSGIGDFPGGDFMVTLGAFSDRKGRPVGTDFMVASTFMHELGHNLELRHGAWKEPTSGQVLPAPNCIPTYLSVMNYLYQLRGLLDVHGKPNLDFSGPKGTEPDQGITEGALADGSLRFTPAYRIGWYAPLWDDLDHDGVLDPGEGTSYLAYPDSAAPGGVASRATIAGRHCDGSAITDSAVMVRVDAPAVDGEIDWNADGDTSDPARAQDVNFNGRTTQKGAVPELPVSFDDWANVHLNQIGSRRNVGGLFIDASGLTRYGPLSIDLGRWDYGRWDYGRWDYGRWDYGRWDYGRWDYGRWDYGVYGGVTAGDLGQGDNGRWDYGRWDYGRWDYGRGDDARGDYGGGDLFVGDPHNPGGCLDHETASLLANTAPYEFTCSLVGLKISCSWAATNEGGELRYDLYRVEGTTLSPDWAFVTHVDADGSPNYSLTFDDDLTKGANYLYFATAVYPNEPGGADEVTSNPSDTASIVGPNHPPVATTGLSLTTDEDTSATITLKGSDADGGDEPTLTYSVASGPGHGTLSGTAPNLTYTPVRDYNGPDSFTFTVSDDTETSAPATVIITVKPVNDAPAAYARSVSVVEDTPTPITLTGFDADLGDVLTYAVTTMPTHGTLSGIPPNLMYSPALNYNGTDGLQFTVSDGTATSAAAKLAITVTSVNDAPVAVDDSYPMPTTGELSVPARGVLANDTDIDSPAAPLTAVLVTKATRGSVALNSDGSFTYTQPLPVTGSDSFTYQAKDESGALSNVAIVRIAAYALVGTQNVPPAASIARAKAGSAVPMKWQFVNGTLVVGSDAVGHTVTVQGPLPDGPIRVITNTDPGSSSFRYDATTKTWSFNLQTKDVNGVAYPVGDYNVRIAPNAAGYLPSTQPFVVKLTK